MLAEQEKQTAKERLKRVKSARQVSRSTVSSSNDGGDPVPKWVMEKGYKGTWAIGSYIIFTRQPCCASKVTSPAENLEDKF
jgi:hypothetical protein